MKRIPFLRRPITHNSKRPHSKAEELDRLSRRNPPFILITTQPLGGEGWGEGTSDFTIPACGRHLLSAIS